MVAQKMQLKAEYFVHAAGIAGIKGIYAEQRNRRVRFKGLVNNTDKWKERYNTVVRTGA